MPNIAKVSNAIAESSKKPKLSTYLAEESVKKALTASLGGDKADKLIADLLAAAASNPGIQACDFKTVTSAGMVAVALNLPLAPQLGYCYVVPFEDRKYNRTVATFVLGYRGYIQLAERTGSYRRIVVLEIKEKEFISYNPLTEELRANINDDSDSRDAENTVGYYAMFELLNGFTKALYWSKKRMTAHALKYSKGYARDIEKGQSFSFWSQNFDEMAKKTMIRQLISKWGIMSTEMLKAFEADSSSEDSAYSSIGEMFDAGDSSATPTADDIFGAAENVSPDDEE